MEEQLEQISKLSSFETILWVLFGIIISLILPIAARTLQDAKLERKESSSLLARTISVWRKYGGDRYLRIISSATLIAVVLVFLLGLEFYNYRDAALAGFAWESLVNKLFGYSQESSRSR